MGVTIATWEPVPWIIIAGYCALMWFLLNAATASGKAFIDRMMFATLGTAFMGFGFGRFLVEFDIYEVWLFRVGHFSFIAYAMMHFYKARRT